MTFEEKLHELTVDRLKSRLDLLRSSSKPTRKADIIDAIGRQMLSKRCRDYWQELDDMEQLAVGEALHNWHGDFNALRFFAKYGEVPEYFQSRSSGYGRSDDRPKRTLLPLFFYDGTIPEQLRRQLVAFVAEPTAEELRTTPEESLPHDYDTDVEGTSYPVEILTMDTVARHDVMAVLRLLSDGKVSISAKTSLPGAAAVRQIEGALMRGDYYAPEQDKNLNNWQGGPIRPIRPYAWPLLLQSGGLAQKNGTKLALTRKGKSALSQPPAETLKELYVRWRTKGMLDEYRRVDLVKGQAGKGRRMTAASDRRMVVEAALKDCPLQAWIGLDEFFRYMQSVGYDFDVTNDYWRLYVGDSHYGSLGYAGYGSFEVLQGRYILVYLFEYLATLGLVDVAYAPPYFARNDFRDIWGTDELEFFSRYDGLLYFRLNPLGAYCLDLCDEYRPTPLQSTAPLLAVDGDLLISSLRETEPAERLILDQYAQTLSAETWQLSAEVMLDAMAAGNDPELFREFLHQHVADSLPAEAEEFLAAAIDRLSALTDAGPARLIRCSSPVLAEMIANDPATQSHCLFAGGSMLAVPENKDKAVRTGLRRLGYVFPKA